MIGSPQIPSNQQLSRLSPPATPERLLLPEPLDLSDLPEPWLPGLAQVGAKRPPSVALDAEHSPNKLRRVASPLSRWAAEASTAAAAHANVLTFGENDASFDDVLAHDHDPLQSPHPLPDSFAAEADPCVFLDDELDMVSHPHSAQDEPQAVIGETEPSSPLAIDAPQVQQAPRRPPLALEDLTQAAHRDLITDMRAQPQKSLQASVMLRFLHHLESLGLDWHTLRGDTSELRPLELETQINAAIKNRLVCFKLRNGLNRIFNLQLRGENGIRPNVPPKAEAHLRLLDELSATATRAEVRLISSLLGCLEAHGEEWHVISQPLPSDHPKRPLALEARMNKAAKDRQILSTVRATVNKLFGLVIKKPRSNNYKLSEHTELMGQLPANLNRRDKAKIVSFLIYLENIKSCWSHEIELLPGAIDPKRPKRLEETVNFASSGTGIPAIHSETRGVLNKVFGLELRDATSCYVTVAEHINALKDIDMSISRNPIDKRVIRRFFLYLEREKKLFSEVKKINWLDAEKQPSALEKMVNELIDDGYFNNGLRAALNNLFDLRLRGPSGRYTKPQADATS
jgi:hypothetical protein